MSEKKIYTADDLNFITKFNHYTGKSGQYAKMHFENGFGISVITPPSYDWGKYELAVLDKDGKLCYSTDVTNDVEVVFDKEELTELMLKVQNLDSNGHLKEKTTEFEKNKDLIHEEKIYTADDLKFESTGSRLTDEAILKFENGFGVSVARALNEDGKRALYNCPYELAVLDKDGKLCYSTDVTNDVLPCADKEELNYFLLKVQNLDTDGCLKEKTALEKRKDQIRKRLQEREQGGVEAKVSGLAVNDELVKIHDSIGTITPEKAKTLSPIIKEAILEKRKHKK